MRFTLDYNGLYAVEVTKQDGNWEHHLVLPDGTFRPFATKLERILSYQQAKDGSLHIFVDGHDFGCVKEEDGELCATHSDYLTVTETRLMGELPWKTGVSLKRGEGQAVGAVFTDFHTHSSSELTGQKLVALALAHEVRYPVRLLEKLGIRTEGVATQQIDRVRFSALEPPSMGIPKQEAGVLLSELSEQDRNKLASAMNMPADRQSTAAAFDLVCYPFRYPLTKNPTILEESYREVGRQYAENGVKYAEITISSPVDDKLLKMLHRVVPEIERETGVSLRFLVGIPRTFGKQDLHASLEKAKIVAKSPYIMGIDIIGYEANKTSEFDAELREFAEWMRRAEPEFTLRVHAGENAKNPDNIQHILEIARDTGARVRVGHAIYGVNDATLKLAERLAKKNQLVLEFNPDSNIALNNIDSLDAIPFRRSALQKIPFVVGSDGSGFYQTSARQLEKDLEHLGLDDYELGLLKKSQEELMNRQLRYSRDKAAKILQFDESAGVREEFASALVAGYANIPPAPAQEKKKTSNGFLPEGVIPLEEEELPDSLKGKHPVLLVGASGGTWKNIPPDEQREAAITVDMLVHALDPAKVYFVMGRAKPEGIYAVLDTANKKQGEARFDLAALHESNLMLVPQRLANFSSQHGGELIAIGGGGFTRDTILEVKHKNILADVDTNPNKAHYYVMANITGASKEKAQVLTDKYCIPPDFRRGKSGKQRFPDAVALVVGMAKERPDWFRDEVKSEHGLDRNKIMNIYKSCSDQFPPTREIRTR